MFRTLIGDLVTGAVAGDRLTHLFEGSSDRSLCSAARCPGTAARSLRAAPCPACLVAAQERGHTVVQENGNAWTNLLRIA